MIRRPSYQSGEVYEPPPELGPPSLTTVAAVVVTYVLVAPFLFIGIQLLTSLTSGSDLIEVPSGVWQVAPEARWFVWLDAFLTLGTCLLLLVLGRWVLKRSPRARSLLIGLMALLASLTLLARVMAAGEPLEEGSTGNFGWLLLISAGQVAVIVLLNLRPSRVEFDIAETRADEKRYAKNLERLKKDGYI